MSTDQKRAAIEFVERWQKSSGREESDARSFWIDLLQNVLGIQNPVHLLSFEHPIRGKKADIVYRDMGILIENKSRGVALDKKEKRGKNEYGDDRMVTPYEQAKWYAENIAGEKPRYLVTCNFDEFWFYDTYEEYPERTVKKLSLCDLPNQLRMLSLFINKSNSLMEKEKQVSMQAGMLIAELFEGLRGQYHDPDLPENQHALNVLCVRLVFCLFCEDAGLFKKDAFLEYLRSVDPIDIRDALKKLFRALNTPNDQRDPYDEKIKEFPYINGGLFSEEVEVPNFTQDLKFLLLFKVSQETDWSKISPTIFGGIFESTLNPVTRREGGMHYTSPENIHKVIDPLFLDDLHAEFESIRAEAGITEKKRRSNLQAFRNKIGSLRFLDPACGSGNFLTETYLCLRKLEDDILRELNAGQTEILFDEIENDKRVSLDQFYGIEINDFAVRVAKTALWIAQLQANNESEMLLDLKINDFPLKDSANILCENALRYNWEDLLAAQDCDYVMGNPPFVGHQWRTEEQKAEMETIFEGVRKYGKLDYVCCWYKITSSYIRFNRASAAFVSTNSICQGESVPILWDYLFEIGTVIDYAYRSFIWDNEASEAAHVHCVIVGFSERPSERKKYLYDANGNRAIVQNINGYLLNAPSISVRSRGRNLNKLAPAMTKGSQPTDAGNLILSVGEKDEFSEKYPELRPYIRTFLGAREFLSDTPRYCLYLKNAPVSAYANCPEVIERLNNVRFAREQSPTKSVRDCANRPTEFTQDRQPETQFLVLPKTTSGRRRYVPIGFLDPSVIVSDKLHIIPSADIYLFGLLESSMHQSWIRTVSGRLKSDYEYAPAVYNSFIWPNPTVDQKERIEKAGQGILNARKEYEGCSLAELYDPDKAIAFPTLMDAHDELNAAVEAAYGLSFNGDEEEIVAHLFKLYAEATASDSC